MKKLILAILIVALSATATYFSVDHYNKYQNQQKVAQQAQVDKEAKLTQELKTVKTENSRLTTQYSTIQLECEKGIAAYGKLTPAQKNALPAPTCGPEKHP